MPEVAALKKSCLLFRVYLFFGFAKVRVKTCEYFYLSILSLIGLEVHGVANVMGVIIGVC